MGCDDGTTAQCLTPEEGFNSRTPRGVRRARQAAVREAKQFQFTHPAWGATPRHSRRVIFGCCFNSRTPRGVRLRLLCSAETEDASFNSRTPRGVRLADFFRPSTSRSFNSRTPRGVRRALHIRTWWLRPVSIHAPRVGCDSKRSKPSPKYARCFNSRTPRGVRLAYFC